MMPIVHCFGRPRALEVKWLVALRAGKRRNTNRLHAWRPRKRTWGGILRPLWYSVLRAPAGMAKSGQSGW